MSDLFQDIQDFLNRRPFVRCPGCDGDGECWNCKGKGAFDDIPHRCPCCKTNPGRCETCKGEGKLLLPDENTELAHWKVQNAVENWSVHISRQYAPAGGRVYEGAQEQIIDTDEGPVRQVTHWYLPTPPTGVATSRQEAQRIITACYAQLGEKVEEFLKHSEADELDSDELHNFSGEIENFAIALMASAGLITYYGGLADKWGFGQDVSAAKAWLGLPPDKESAQ